MDYGTFFLTNIATVTVFAVSMCVLAWYNRRVAGMIWFAGALITGLAKLVLQGLEGKLPPFYTDLPANELYFISFMMQWMGLRWFVVRKRLPNPAPWILAAIIVIAYPVMFLARIPYSANVLNVPFVFLCGATAWMLLRYGRDAFLTISRVTGAILIGQMTVAAYRAVLTNEIYPRPWKTVYAQADPRWDYSLAAGAFLAACMVMCELWFLVTELRRELAAQARTDPLTGALNRRGMEEAAARETARSVRHGYPLCMVMIDIDQFKRLNDSRGHAAGDRALQALVNLVKAHLRSQDVLARTGGEEFAVLLPDTPVAGALLVAERVRRDVEQLEIAFDSGPIRFTISAGLAPFHPAHGFETMMRHADAAMYAAKENGRNQVLTYSAREHVAEHWAANGSNPPALASG